MKKERNKIKGLDNEDDNRVIASMNIEGMPWHAKGKPVYEESKEPVPELSKKELRRLTLTATLGSLLIGAVILFVFYLFILFCVYVWF